MTKEMLKKNTVYRMRFSFDNWYYTGKTKQIMVWDYSQEKMVEKTAYLFDGAFDARNVEFTEDQLQQFRERGW